MNQLVINDFKRFLIKEEFSPKMADYVQDDTDRMKSLNQFERITGRRSEQRRREQHRRPRLLAAPCGRQVLGTATPSGTAALDSDSEPNLRIRGRFNLL